jgi:hypothetical protein
LKTLKPVLLYLAIACLVFYIFMWLGHYLGQKDLETQYPLVSAFTGEPTSWNAKEKQLMAAILPKCKTENASGDFEKMKSCWISHAAAISDDGSSSKLLNSLLSKHAGKNS